MKESVRQGGRARTMFSHAHAFASPHLIADGDPEVPQVVLASEDLQVAPCRRAMSVCGQYVMRRRQ